MGIEKRVEAVEDGTMRVRMSVAAKPKRRCSHGHLWDTWVIADGMDRTRCARCHGHFERAVGEARWRRVK